MNPEIIDFNKPQEFDKSKKIPSKILDKELNCKIFQTAADFIWNRESSQRQFITNPNDKTPNDQGEFAHWLYSTKDNCKSGSIYMHRRLDSNATKNCSTGLNVPKLTNYGIIN